ncbi:TetR/AcrR family transcriptional regulator [Mycobacterium sp. 852002-51057_SCH5723018]|uniref:TetR/AcrR family transcriptional regulator n=1 Tax=Mycobacterium sp. 852002-51057_SCH5723018 TaxID=1834094 RepID=UPI0008017C90|nr:TetR/AcrR family transcriptional regulator [Mycobacterium sp. 852002-51057_SCH5723018]OBG20758.1 TetR family transcriptional regulator [Mycobacterium sp. 852002-51057_SCH5723018]
MSAAKPPAPSTATSLTSSRVTAAVERALDERQRDATEEVERILAAAVRVMERVAPDPPRVSDIVAEAGSSNKAFYRYFAGKDDLILAVMERGVAIVVSYLQHQMAKESQPRDKIARWIEGTLAQVAEPHLRSKSRAAAGQMSAGTNWRAADQEMMRPLRDLLIEPITELDSTDVERDVEAVFCCTAATMRRYMGSADRPGPDDIAHVVRFCLNGLGVS